MKRCLTIQLCWVPLLTIFFATPSIGAEDTGNESDATTAPAARIDSILERSVANGFAGSVLVARDGKILLAKGYGLADRSLGIPVTPATVSNIGSVTKQFTAAAILKLVEQGKLTTAQTLGSLFDHVPGDKRDITIHQLLTHTSGISPETGGPRYETVSRSTFLRELFAAELETKPGTRHEYANAGYILLAAIVEVVSGKDFDTFLRTNLFEPAGMTATGYDKTLWNDRQVAHGYYFSLEDAGWKDWGMTSDHWDEGHASWYAIGKGDVHSTVEDLFRWHVALQTGTVLPRELVTQLETPWVPENAKGTSHYGYGWAIFQSDRGTKVVAHNGSNGLFFADFLRFVEEDVVVILLTNVALAEEPADLAWALAKMIFDPQYETRPIPKSSYELVFHFVEHHQPEAASELPGFLAESLGHDLDNRRVLNSIGYQLLANEQCDWSVALLEINVGLFAGDGNLFDSLGEVAQKCGQRVLARKSFEQALSLAPGDDCGWCESSRRGLKALVEPDLPGNTMPDTR
ncbi:MAG: beta-lactamase family protein [Thermoanaerobaculia bacterium]|nr:beta-lactamase family protein [Thermoanaerobaculia bacterium]